MPRTSNKIYLCQSTENINILVNSRIYSSVLLKKRLNQLENMMHEMTKLIVSFLSVCETRWINCSDVFCDIHGVIYAGEENSNRATVLILDQYMNKCVL